MYEGGSLNHELMGWVNIHWSTRFDALLHMVQWISIAAFMLSFMKYWWLPILTHMQKHMLLYIWEMLMSCDQSFAYVSYFRFFAVSFQLHMMTDKSV